MTDFRKLAVRIGMFSLLSVMPLAAQVENGVLFTAPFPFYAGNVEFPAGSYKLTEPDMNYKVALIQNIAGTEMERCVPHLYTYDLYSSSERNRSHVPQIWRNWISGDIVGCG